MAQDTSPQLETFIRAVHSRREFLRLVAKGGGFAALATLLPACGSSSGPAAPAATVAIPRASPEYVALKRTSFGVHRDALAAMRSIGIDSFLEQQLDYTSINDGTLEADIEGLFPATAPTQTAKLLLESFLGGFPDNIYAVATQMIAATQYRQLFSQRQLYEVMVEFWSDHFNIHLVNGLGPTLKPVDDREVIRVHALGNFRDLLHASAKSPAMLFYLDNFFNQAIAPNENYARELMELHTLGVDGGYSEDDIKEVAKCFTGWTLKFPGDPAYGEFVYVDAIHDPGPKLVLGNPIAAGGGQTDALQVLDILAAHPSTAQFIATKLCQRFISDSPAQDTIDAVAAAFTFSNGDIKDTLRALFATDAFRNDVDLKFTRPSEYLPALARALAPDSVYPTDNGQFWFFAQSILGQLPFYWPTPDGYPDEQSYWANTGGLLNRWRLSFLSYAGIIPEVDVFTIDYPAMLNGADTLSTVIDSLVDQILMRPLSGEHRALVMTWLQDEFGVTADEVLPVGAPEQVAPLIAAVLVSSVYFQLR